MFMACLVYWIWIKHFHSKSVPMYLKETAHPPRDWELGSVNTQRAWKLLLVSWERWQSQTLSAPTHPPVLLSCAQSRAKGCGKKWFSVQLGSGLVPGASSSWLLCPGFQAVTRLHTEVCECQWPGLLAILFSFSSSDFSLESVAC